MTENPYEPPEGPAVEDTEPHEQLPELRKDGSFWGLITTQFLGAFNDNLFKQLVLLLAIPVGVSAAHQQDQQGLAIIMFALPFVLFSGYAGFLSDRLSKRKIIVPCKIAEIVVMVVGLIVFFSIGNIGYAGLLVVLFLMGTQSAFFGPGKYGILPEMLRERDLPRANGIMMMTTFLAIIFGIAIAGALGAWLTNKTHYQILGVEHDASQQEIERIYQELNSKSRDSDMARPSLSQRSIGEAYAVLSDPAKRKLYDDKIASEMNVGRLWIGSLFCIAIACIGTATSLLIRRVPAARPDLKFQLSAIAVPKESRRVLVNDRPLLLAILASCLFWLVAGIAAQAVNSFGMRQVTNENKFLTSILTAIIGVGIAIGAIAAGRLSRGRSNPQFVKLGLWGMIVCLLLLSISPGGDHLLGFGGSLVVLALLGVFAAFFSIPIQVFIQARPPKGLKGRMIAVMNQANFVAILLAGVIWMAFDGIIAAKQWPRSVAFAMMAALMLPAAVFYRLNTSPRMDSTDNRSDAVEP